MFSGGFRRLQNDEDEGLNVFIKFNGQQGGEETPTMSPTPEPKLRSSNYRACDDQSQGAAPNGVVNLGFVYDIETNVDSISEAAEKTMLDYLNTAMIDSVYETKCSSSNNNRRRRRQLDGRNNLQPALSRRLDIVSISGDTRDIYIGPCDASSGDGSQGCRSYDGSLVVGFNDVGEDVTHDGVGNSVMDIITSDMAAGKYNAGLNAALQGEGIQVTKTQLVSQSFIDPQQVGGFSGLRNHGYVQQGGGLTMMGKAVVPVIVILLIGVVVACYMAQRPKHKKEATTYVQKSDLSYYGKGDGEISCMSPDIRNLAKGNRQMNVHSCNKTNCRACNRHPSNGPTFIPTKLDQEFESYAHPIEAESNPDSESQTSRSEPDAIFSMGKNSSGPNALIKSLFGLGRRKPQDELVQVLEEAETESPSEDQEQEEQWHDEPKDLSFAQVVRQWYDEPKDLSFIQVCRPPPERDEVISDLDLDSDPDLDGDDVDVGVGVKRTVIDHSGYVRNEVEL